MREQRTSRGIAAAVLAGGLILGSAGASFGATSPGLKGYEGQPGNQGGPHGHHGHGQHGSTGYEGQPGNQGG